MKNILSKLSISFVSLLLLTLVSCETTPPTSYIPEYVIEAYLTVDYPITGVLISRSLPITDTFSIEKSIVTDAVVEISSPTETFILQYRPTKNKRGEYFLPDTTKLVQPNTLYKLRVTAKDGKIMTGQTTTPSRISWIAGKEPKAQMYYPKDTVNLVSPDSLAFAWTKAANISEYFIRLQCLDTLEYGKYLTPPTTEMNRRRKYFFDNQLEGNPQYDETTFYGFIQGTSINTVWTAFRWYGSYELRAVAPDYNFNKWFKSRWAGNQYDANLGSIKGGVGVFGSSSVAVQKIFLFKNQP